MKHENKKFLDNFKLVRQKLKDLEEKRPDTQFPTSGRRRRNYADIRPAALP